MFFFNKKSCLVFLSVFILVFFSACQSNDSLEEVTLRKDDEIDINFSGPVCSYGKYIVAICHNKTTANDEIAIFEKDTNLLIKKYQTNNDVSILKPVDNENICFLWSDDYLSYHLLNFKTGKISKITPELQSEYNISSINPFFIQDDIFIVATTTIPGQGEPFFSIFKKVDNEYINIVKYCTQFQFFNNSLYVDSNNDEILKIDANENISTYKNFPLDLTTALIKQNKVVSNTSGVFKITDIETNTVEWIAVSQFENIPSAMTFYNDSLIFSDVDGIFQWNFNTYKIEKICEYSFGNCSIFDNSIYFEANNSIFNLNLKTNELTQIC